MASKTTGKEFRVRCNNFGIDCLTIQLGIFSGGKSAQVAIRENGQLQEIKKKYSMLCQRRKATYFLYSPCAVNLFWSCVSCPTNRDNQNELRDLIPELITVLKYIKNKRRMRKHICGHWLLLQGLLKKNRGNVKTFIANDGQQLIQDYVGCQGVQRCLDAIQRSVAHFISKPVNETDVPEVDQTEGRSDVEPVQKEDHLENMDVSEHEECENEADRLGHGKSETPVLELDDSVHEGGISRNFNAGAGLGVSQNQAALDELNRIVARTKLRKEERILRESLEAKNSTAVQDFETPVKKLLSVVLKRLSWGKT